MFNPALHALIYRRLDFFVCPWTKEKLLSVSIKLHDSFIAAYFGKVVSFTICKNIQSVKRMLFGCLLPQSKF